MNADESKVPGGQHIPDIIIDINCLVGVDIKPLDQQPVDLRKGFAHLFLAGYEPSVKPMQKLI